MTARTGGRMDNPAESLTPPPPCSSAGRLAWKTSTRPYPLSTLRRCSPFRNPQTSYAPRRLAQSKVKARQSGSLLVCRAALFHLRTSCSSNLGRNHPVHLESLGPPWLYEKTRAGSELDEPRSVRPASQAARVITSLNRNTEHGTYMFKESLAKLRRGTTRETGPATQVGLQATWFPE
ncbi:hypothetical protein LZ30DRAFT_744014 [Colletotrichum cereale]|nr:hypothetical protein LZ30DRAFT_744014 [Colletotrichum cereale]